MKFKVTVTHTRIFETQLSDYGDDPAMTEEGGGDEE